MEKKQAAEVNMLSDEEKKFLKLLSKIFVDNILKATGENKEENERSEN